MITIAGIDLGSKNSVIAVVENGGVEIVTNEDSGRSTPVVVSFGTKERQIGEQAVNQLKSNFRNSIQCVTRFLGLNPDYERLEEEKKWLTSKLVETEHKRIGFEVKYQQQTCVFTCEEVVSMFLQKIKQILKNSKRANKDMCISVPCYLSQIERLALLDACKIADINCLKLMNNDTAIALNYGLFRQKEFSQQPRSVCFVDMGYSKTTVSIASFTNEKLQIISRAFDRNLGGRDFDNCLIQKFAKDFEKKYQTNPLENPKAVIRMQEQIEKLKKILSSNTEAELSIENLINDNDLNALIQRKEFERLCEPLIRKFHNLLEEATLNIDKNEIHSVEIVGGSTRIPAIQQTITNFFNLEVSRTLQAQECIARGCAVQAAILSPIFKVKAYGIEDISTYPIAIKEQNSQAQIIFPAFTPFPQVQSLQYQKKNSIEVEAYYQDWNIKGIQGNIGVYSIEFPQSSKDLQIQIFAKLNVHSIFTIENEEHEEDVMKSDVPSNKKSKKKVQISIQTKGLREEEIKEAIEREYVMEQNDKLIRETQESRNDLESYIYKMRNNLTSIYNKYIDSQQNQQFQAILQEAEQ